MDEKFFQFWLDFIKQAGNGRMRLDNILGWMRPGPDVKNISEIPDELMRMFKKYYGLDQMPAGAPDYSSMFESALAEFKHSLSNLYSILDVVPKKDYLDLEKKYNILRKKVADLEEGIQHLKLLFKTNQPNVEAGIGSLNNMLKNQNEQFLKMMDNLAEFYGVSREKNDEKE